MRVRGLESQAALEYAGQIDHTRGLPPSDSATVATVLLDERVVRLIASGLVCV